MITLTLLIPHAAAAQQVLTIEQVLQSSLEHFPRIQAAVEEVLVREGKLENARGAFDLALEQESLVWASGYYEGVSAAQQLVKPLAAFGAKTYAGYRVTANDFPIYQQELVTNNGGEFNFGVVLSLWRDREIDQRRFSITDAKLGIRDADLDLLLAKLTTQRNAARAYWLWTTMGHRLEVYRELAALADGRVAAFEQRAAEGDIAAIAVTENRQNLLRRRALLVQAERDFDTAAIDLSLYLRDENGKPRRPQIAQLPGAVGGGEFNVVDASQLVDEILALRPELLQLEIELSIERARLKLAENELLPRVDLGVKAGHDLGSGSPTRDGFDAIVDVQVSIPLERQRGKGLVAQSRARLRQLELEKKLTEDRLANEIRKLATNINAAHAFMEIASEESTQAGLMQEAEYKRFSSGASDFFLVNLREERSADARIRALDARLQFLNNLTDLQAIRLDYAALGI